MTKNDDKIFDLLEESLLEVEDKIRQIKSILELRRLEAAFGNKDSLGKVTTDDLFPQEG